MVRQRTRQVHPLLVWHAHHPLTVLRRRHPWGFALVTAALVFLVGGVLDLLGNGEADHTHVSTAVALGWFVGIGAATHRSRARRRGRPSTR